MSLGGPLVSILKGRRKAKRESRLKAFHMFDHLKRVAIKMEKGSRFSERRGRRHNLRLAWDQAVATKFIKNLNMLKCSLKLAVLPQPDIHIIHVDLGPSGVAKRLQDCGEHRRRKISPEDAECIPLGGTTRGRVPLGGKRAPCLKPSLETSKEGRESRTKRRWHAKSPCKAINQTLLKGVKQIRQIRNDKKKTAFMKRKSLFNS
jgi:hypothetical protein